MSLTDALLLDPHPFEVWIAYRTDGIKGSGTLNDPWDGSTAARFDAIMAGLPVNTPTRVHLGPCPRNGNVVEPFRTAGFRISSTGVIGSAWQARPNMVLSGAGPDVTVLRLEPGTTTGTHYFAVGASPATPVHHFELCDLTIDCNLPSGDAVACGAVRVFGHHVRIRNVKCVEWGSRTPAQPGFVIALLLADPGNSATTLQVEDAGMENCVATSPSTHNDAAGAVVNVLHAGGRELSGSTPLAMFGKAPFIRNCFVDGAYPAGNNPATPVAEFRALSMGACHGGIVEGNQIHNVAIGGPYQEKLNTREIIVRNNFYRNVVRGPYLNHAAAGTGEGVARLVIEGNSLELPTSTTAPALPGIQVSGGTGATQAHGDVVIRRNRLRYVDSLPGDYEGTGIAVQGAATVTVSDNLVELMPANPLQNANCGAATYFNNRTPAGKLVRGFNTVTQTKYDELETEAEDAFVLAFMSKR